MGWPIGWTDAKNECEETFVGFPKGQGAEQHSYEPARTVEKSTAANRVARIAMIGNGVVPQQGAIAYRRLIENKAA
ncbi:hypothetical protein BH10ACI4_BH10ACI4_25130 [soil metagenome]